MVNDYSIYELQFLDKFFQWGMPLEMACGILERVQQGQSLPEACKPAFEQIKATGKDCSK